MKTKFGIKRLFKSIFKSKAYSYCSICEEYFNFSDFGSPTRSKVLCPKCNSLERHRLQWLYLRQKSSIFDSEFTLLHIAPETVFYDEFSNIKSLIYTGVDQEPQKRGLLGKIDKGDVLDLKYEDESFDGIICNHVLEHVPDDQKAMRELFRVLKPNGFAILQVPMSSSEVTDEVLSITSPEERTKRFGQYDHVRLYGKDYKQRLESVGFTVTVDDFVRSNFSNEEIKKYGLAKSEDLYIGRKK